MENEFSKVVATFAPMRESLRHVEEALAAAAPQVGFYVDTPVLPPVKSGPTIIREAIIELEEVVAQLVELERARAGRDAQAAIPDAKRDARNWRMSLFNTLMVAGAMIASIAALAVAAWR